MKTIDHALELRGRIFGAFEMAKHESDPVARRRWLTFVLVGAGPTGVELAGQLAELLRRSLRRNFRHIDPANARVLLLDAGPTILSAFPEGLRERAMRDLSAIGIEIHLGPAVTHVDERGLETNSAVPEPHRIEAAFPFSGGVGLRTRTAQAHRPSRSSALRPRGITGRGPNRSASACWARMRTR